MGEARRKTLNASTRIEPLHARNHAQDRARRQTTTGITAQELRKSVEKPLLRIEKPRETRRKETRKNENYAEAFQGQLDAYKTGLISTLNSSFAKTDGMLEKSMDTLFADFEKRCGVIETAAAGAHASFQAEKLEVVDEQGNKTELVLGDEMEFFINVFTSSKRRLDQLWLEYQQTQRSIMELAVSILDDKTVKIRYNHLDPAKDTADPRLDEDRAQEQRNEATELYNTAMSDLEGIRSALGALVEEKLNTSNQLLKDFKKQTAQMQKTMLGLLNDIQG